MYGLFVIVVLILWAFSLPLPRGRDFSDAESAENYRNLLRDRNGREPQWERKAKPHITLKVLP